MNTMNTINFFKNFATLKLADVADDKSKRLVDNKVVDDVVIDKLNAVRIDDDNEKDVKKMFIHSRNVIMRCGNYKGYTGFVYEYEKEKLNVLIEEYVYVLAERYGVVKMGGKVMTEYGESIVVSEVDSMYKISSLEDLISLPKGCFIRIVSYMEGKKRIWCEYKNKGSGFEMVSLDVCGTTDECLNKLSDALKLGKFVDLYGDVLTKSKDNSMEEYYMVCEEPKKKSDNNFFGRYGKLCSEIPKQYLVKYKRTVKVPKSIVKVNKKEVTFKSGLLAGKVGEFLGVESASLTIGIDAFSKKITEHLVKSENGYSTRKISPNDVFYCDVELNDGVYFQVNECYEDKNGDTYFVGVKRCDSSVSVTIMLKEIKKELPGFKVITSNTSSKEEKDLIADEREYVADNQDEIEEVNDVDDEALLEKEIEEGFYKEPEVSDNNDVSNDKSQTMECDMKETFKDVERSFYTQRVLSKDEKEYMKMIEKCVTSMGDVSNIYTLLDNTNNAVSFMKEELGKGKTILEWKNTDTKYIVACLVMYDMIRGGIRVTTSDFKRNILKLYKSGYFTKNTIANTLFIRSNTDDETGLLKKIEKSGDEILLVKKMYKEMKYLEIIEMMVENCNTILQCCFGKVLFENNSTEIELIAVSKPNAVREYPKYFLTPSDVMNDVMVDSAKRVMWCPKSQKMIDAWKNTLSGKIEKEENEIKKSVYIYVKDNLEQSPFILRNLEKSADDMDQLRYRELKRSFEIFKDRLRVYLGKLKNEKSNDMEVLRLEKERVMKRRLEISNVDGRILDAPDIKGCSVKVLEQKKKLRRI